MSTRSLVIHQLVAQPSPTPTLRILESSFPTGPECFLEAKPSEDKVPRTWPGVCGVQALRGGCDSLGQERMKRALPQP